MKRQLKLLVVCALSVLALSSCKMSEEELTKLTEEVKKSMAKSYSERDVKVIDLSQLIHKGGNEYTGVVILRNKYGYEKTTSVDVIYDGNHLQWSTK